MANRILDIDVESIRLSGNLVFDFKAFQREITPLIFLTKGEPETELEKFVVDARVETEGSITPETIERVKALHAELQSKIATQALQFDEAMDQIPLELDNLKQNESLKLGYSVCGWKILQTAKELLVALKEIKTQKLTMVSKAVMGIRSELRLLWRESMISDEEGDFPEFHSLELTEEVLRIHEDELRKWKAYHKKNQALFRQLQIRVALWQRLKELKIKDQDPHKFVNRGAILLKTQTEMQQALVALGKCEETLKSLVKAFEEENGKKVLIRGKELSDIIESDWNDYKRMRDTGAKTSRSQVIGCQPRTTGPVVIVHSPSRCGNKPERFIYGSNTNISAINTRSRVGK